VHFIFQDKRRLANTSYLILEVYQYEKHINKHWLFKKCFAERLDGMLTIYVIAVLLVFLARPIAWALEGLFELIEFLWDHFLFTYFLIHGSIIWWASEMSDWWIPWAN